MSQPLNDAAACRQPRNSSGWLLWGAVAVIAAAAVISGWKLWTRPARITAEAVTVFAIIQESNYEPFDVATQLVVRVENPDGAILLDGALVIDQMVDDRGNNLLVHRILPLMAHQPQKAYCFSFSSPRIRLYGSGWGGFMLPADDGDDFADGFTVNLSSGFTPAVDAKTVTVSGHVEVMEGVKKKRSLLRNVNLSVGSSFYIADREYRVVRRRADSVTFRSAGASSILRSAYYADQQGKPLGLPLSLKARKDRVAADVPLVIEHTLLLPDDPETVSLVFEYWETRIHVLPLNATLPIEREVQEMWAGDVLWRRDNDSHWGPPLEGDVEKLFTFSGKLWSFDFSGDTVSNPHIQPWSTTMLIGVHCPEVQDLVSYDAVMTSCVDSTGMELLRTSVRSDYAPSWKIQDVPEKFRDEIGGELALWIETRASPSVAAKYLIVEGVLRAKIASGAATAELKDVPFKARSKYEAGPMSIWHIGGNSMEVGDPGPVEALEISLPDGRTVSAKPNGHRPYWISGLSGGDERVVFDTGEEKPATVDLRVIYRPDIGHYRVPFRVKIPIRPGKIEQ